MAFRPGDGRGLGTPGRAFAGVLTLTEPRGRLVTALLSSVIIAALTAVMLLVR
ncbi:hypothetical protein [Micromonospora sp. RTGN7]|uniref:hypothetical protein n=1 Tax=Micromonospora sp. RTGN7 TaxID=3016526 RepID=UPI0029FF0504|nr:hypothetical protein [Micromonospora sp. RTGN7]